MYFSFGSLPKHDVVGLPALSPTMEVGTIVKWNMKEGHEFTPGDVFADVSRVIYVCTSLVCV